MTASLLEQLADLPKAEVDALIRAMASREASAFEHDWRYRARPEQLPPAGSWRVWRSSPTYPSDGAPISWAS